MSCVNAVVLDVVQVAGHLAENANRGSHAVDNQQEVVGHRGFLHQVALLDVKSCNHTVCVKAKRGGFQKSYVSLGNASCRVSAGGV